MKKWFSDQLILIKLLISMISLLVILLAVVSTFQIVQQNQLLKNELNKRLTLMRNHMQFTGRLLSDQIARQVESAIANYSFYNLSEDLNREIRSGTLSYAILMDSNRIAIVHTLKPELEMGELTDKNDIFAFNQLNRTTTQLEINQHSFLEFIIPINFTGQHWGTLRLGFSLEAYQAELIASKKLMDLQIRVMIVKSLIVFGIFLVVFILLIIYISKLITRPLSILTTLFQRFAQGDKAVTTDVYFESKDEIGILGRTFIQMVDDINESHAKLEEYNRTLEQKVEERTLQLQQSQKEMTDILKSISQGIFTINPDLSLNYEHSLKAEELFGITQFNESSLQELFGIDLEKEETYKSWMALLKTKPELLTRFYQYAPLAPVQELQKNNRILSVDYQPIIENQELQKMMILCKDITAQRNAELLAHEIKQTHELQMQRILALIGQDQVLLSLFIRQTEQLFQKWPAELSISQIKVHHDELFREFHTLKGTGGSFGFLEFSKLAANIELLLIKVNKDEPFDFFDWESAWVRIKTEFSQILSIQKLLFQQQEDELIIQRNQYQSLLKQCTQKKPVGLDAIFKQLYQFDSLSLDVFCKKFNNIITLYTRTHDKEIQPIQIIDEKKRVPRDLIAILDPMVVHLVKNAIDHGIEDRQTRAVLGKGSGMISVDLTHQNDYTLFIIRDDGKGIDPDQIGQACVKKGLITAGQLKDFTKEEKINLLYTPGFSTMNTITETSGCGVGMDAVAHKIKSINGKIIVHTELNKGTEWQLWIPNRIILEKFTKQYDLEMTLIEKFWK